MNSPNQSSFSSHALSKETEPFVVRPREAAQYLSISERTLRELLATGKISYVKLDRAVLIEIAELKEFIRRHTIIGGDS